MNEGDVLSLVNGNKAMSRRVVRAAGDRLHQDEHFVLELIANELGVDKREVQLKWRPKREREEDPIEALKAIVGFIGILKPQESLLRVHLQNVALRCVRSFAPIECTYGISERARHLGLDLPVNQQYRMGRAVLAAYMEYYKKRPQQRVFLDDDNHQLMMNCYTVEECHQVVDPELISRLQQEEEHSSVFSSEQEDGFVHY